MSEEIKRVVVYHSADLDGKCSAAIVLRFWRSKGEDVELVPFNYGDEVPLEKLRGADVYLVDVSFPMQNMVDLALLARDVVWIDHHKTAINAAAKTRILKRENGSWYTVADLLGSRSLDESGCELTWRYFYAGAPMPEAVRMLGQWDTWAWSRLPDPDRSRIERFQYGLRAVAIGTDPGSSVWTELINKHELSTAIILVNKIVDDGEAILRYREVDNEFNARSVCFETELDGVLVLAANRGLVNSSFFDSVWPKHPDCKAMLTWQWRGGRWRFSLYSDRDFDCGELAQCHGGGGHFGAAGFESDVLPFELPHKAPTAAAGEPAERFQVGGVYRHEGSGKLLRIVGSAHATGWLGSPSLVAEHAGTGELEPVGSDAYAATGWAVAPLSAWWAAWLEGNEGDRELEGKLEAAIKAETKEGQGDDDAER